MEKLILELKNLGFKIDNEYFEGFYYYSCTMYGFNVSIKCNIETGKCEFLGSDCPKITEKMVFRYLKQCSKLRK